MPVHLMIVPRFASSPFLIFISSLSLNKQDNLNCALRCLWKQTLLFFILNFDWLTPKLLQVTNPFFQKRESKVVLIHDVMLMYPGMARGQE